MLYNIEYLETRNGGKTIRVNQYLLHSKYNPNKEAERIIKKEYKENYVHILFGYGRGYLADAFYQHQKNSEVLLIIDPIKEELHIENKEVFNFEMLDQFKIKLENSLEYFDTEVHVICSPNYEKLFPEEYKGILQLVKEVQITNKVISNTIERYSEQWQENLIHNMVYLIEDQLLDVYYKQVQKPIVIASGGPSLSKQLSIIKEHRATIFLMAAGSTINSLLHEGIIPDMVVSVDGGDMNYQHFKDITINIPLVYSLNNHYKIQKEWNGLRYVFIDLKDTDMQAKINKKYNINLPLIQGGGSVANYCYSIATALTDKPIALIGQDLAYTNLQSHAVGNRSGGEISQEFLLNRKAFEILDCNGKKTYTDYPFMSMKKDFEELVVEYPPATFVYNCTEAGIPIEGITNLDFIEFIKKFSSKNVNVDNTKMYSKSHIEWSLLKENFITEISLCTKLAKECSDMILIMKQDYYRKQFSSTTLKALKNIDLKLKETIENEIMLGSSLEPLIRAVLLGYKGHSGETEEEKFDRVYKQNIHWYQGIADAMKNMQNYIENAIKLGDELY